MYLILGYQLISNLSRSGCLTHEGDSHSKMLLFTLRPTPETHGSSWIIHACSIWMLQKHQPSTPPHPPPDLNRSYNWYWMMTPPCFLMRQQSCWVPTWMQAGPDEDLHSTCGMCPTFYRSTYLQHMCLWHQYVRSRNYSRVTCICCGSFWSCSSLGFKKADVESTNTQKTKMTKKVFPLKNFSRWSVAEWERMWAQLRRSRSRVNLITKWYAAECSGTWQVLIGNNSIKCSSFNFVAHSFESWISSGQIQTFLLHLLFWWKGNHIKWLN